jgi:hypothetical protein
MFIIILRSGERKRVESEEDKITSVQGRPINYPRIFTVENRKGYFSSRDSFYSHQSAGVKCKDGHSVNRHYKCINSPLRT